MVLFWTIQICVITTIMRQKHGYVLFAANLDDFRSIAKKFIPEKLADQIAAMASESSAKYRQNAVEKDVDYDETNESEGDSTKPHAETTKASSKKRYVIKNHIPEVNLDELVEKVRDRLAKGKNKPRQKAPAEKQRNSGKKFEHAIKSPIEDNTGYVDYSYNSYSEKADNNREQIEKDYGELTTKRHKLHKKAKTDIKYEETQNNEEAKDYQESVTQSDAEPKYPDDDKIFHEFDLQKANDSYEDYVTPTKETMYDSQKPSRTTKRKRLRQVSIYKKPKYIQRSTPKDYDDIKARTESLMYDDKEVRANRTVDGVVRNTRTKKGKGTMIPTREHYKMSTPNYYKKLPVIAEKYNFDEPLPEKDREPENLKHIPNPPARINKKVKL